VDEEAVAFLVVCDRRNPAQNLVRRVALRVDYWFLAKSLVVSLKMCSI